MKSSDLMTNLTQVVMMCWVDHYPV